MASSRSRAGTARNDASHTTCLSSDEHSSLLEHTRCGKLYCADPYKHWEDDSYPDAMNLLPQTNFDQKYEETKDRLGALFGSRVAFMRMTSQEASVTFGAKSVDLVYIDGNHEYKAVSEDIASWLPKLRDQGYLLGDDVISTRLEDHDDSGNIFKNWGSSTSYGKYGTYKAALDASQRFNRPFIIHDMQFFFPPVA